MKETVGFGVLLAIGVAALRVTSGPALPGEGSGRQDASTHRAVHVMHSVAAASSAYKGGCTVFESDADDPAHPKDKYPKDANRGAAKGMIDTFFGLEGHAATLNAKPGVRYAIALAPDPRHTNLSLVFDRELVAIQQAAQDDGYTYNSSWLPWRPDPPATSHPEDQQRQEDETDQREACPGVLLFRKSVDDIKVKGLGDAAGQPSHAGTAVEVQPKDPYGQALVVLVVGEQPTGGLNEDQWANAITWLNRNVSGDAASSRTLSILGPSFSGSLVSLERDLAALPAGARKFPSAQTPIHILSGSVSSCSSTRWFNQRLQQTRAGTTLFGSFLENDELEIYRLLNYLKHQGTDTADVAILSEDETAYANAYTPRAEEAIAPAEPVPACDFPYARRNRPVKLSYPRDISALRTAYEKQSVFSGGAGVRAAHPILQEHPGTEGEPTASDTIRTFSGPMSPVTQEAVLYGIVSYLRAHRSRYIVLRCTNPLDFLFLTRFFHRAYPEGRVVTVGADLLFRREIDTTEFRGVMALTSASLIPRNQHWSWLSEKPDGALPIPHTHRTPESYAETSYLAARYLFDGAITLNTPADHQRPLLLPFKEDLPDFADPFWLHQPGESFRDKPIQAPTWLTVVGRDGYWPIAVLNPKTTPNERLDFDPDLPQTPPMPAPPSSMVQMVSSTAHYDGTLDHRHFYPTLLFSAPLPWWICLVCALLLLTYQTVAVAQGSKHSSMGLYAPFRRLSTPSQNILLGINCALTLTILLELFTIRSGLPKAGLFSTSLFTRGWIMELSPFMLVVMLVALAIPLLAGLALRFRPMAFLSFAVVYYAAAYGTSVTLTHTLTTTEANNVPLFYRIGHITGGVSPLVPILFLLAGFYLWTWQALAGNALLCDGRPILPRLKPKLCHRVSTRPWLRLRFKRAVTFRINLRRLWRTFWGSLVGLRPDRCIYRGTPLLDRYHFRISHEMDKSILRSASPLSFPFSVVVLPAALFFSAVVFLRYNGPQLLGLEGHAYAWVINLALLFAFLITIAEAGRLYVTWIDLRRLLTALNRLRLRRTFSKLRAVDSNSLWGVSGNVQRIQYLFLSQQLDAARRLSKMHLGGSLSIQRAIECGNRFAHNCAKRLSTGPLWEKSVLPKGEMPQIFMREVLNDAVADVLHTILIPHWANETDSLSLQNSTASCDMDERNTFDMKLSDNDLIKAAEEFVCFHYIAFIQNILARMRTMILSMIFLFVSVCLSISFYPFVPRTGVGMWMMVNLLLIAASVIYVYAGMERDETLSYITNTRPGKLSTDFYVKVATFLAGPVLGLLTTQFPAISESILGILQPGLDALK